MKENKKKHNKSTDKICNTIPCLFGRKMNIFKKEKISALENKVRGARGSNSSSGYK